MHFCTVYNFGSPVRLEPTTYRLTADRSAIELRKIIAYSTAIGVKFQLANLANYDTGDDAPCRVQKWMQCTRLLQSNYDSALSLIDLQMSYHHIAGENH